MNRSQWREYPVIAIDVIDGDTVKAVIDVGFDTFVKAYCRLLDVDAPDKGKEEREAGDHLLRLCARTPLSCRTYKTRSGWTKKGKFGRYLIELFGADGANLNLAMLQSGHAKPYGG